MRDSIERTEPSPERRLEGRQVLIVFCAFFGVIFAVNGYFLVAALRTHTGVVSIEPYRKGLAYNDRISASDRQASLGWTDVVSREPDGALLVRIADANGAPIEGLMLAGIVGRAASASTDMTLIFKETTGGHYRAETQVLQPGTWLVAIEARRTASDTEPEYRARRRLWLDR